MNSKYNNFFIYTFILFVICIFVYSFMFFPTGYVGTTRKGGVNLGCVCHGDTATSIVSVVITGPDSVAAGTTVFYQIKASHGPAIDGGFNVANYRDGGSDTLTLSKVPGDTMVKKQDGELTHSNPKPFVNDTVSWTFRYTASNFVGYDTLYATANSTNDNGHSDGDQWNWSLNKPVRVYNPIGIINISSISKEFSISQNFPNPFNPLTRINFSIAKQSDIKIRIFDILGNLIAEPVHQKLNTGEYSINFNASNLASGTYFYSLIADGITVSTRKMLIIK